MIRFDRHHATLVVCAVLCRTATAHGTVIRVPEDQPSILAAVDLAVSGDSVLVGPGNWTDRDTRVVQVGHNTVSVTSAAFLKPGLTVIGREGPEATVVDAGPADKAGVITFLIAQSGGERTRLVGMTITGGGDGVVVAGAARMEIEGCWLSDNVRTAVEFGDSDLFLSNCLVKGNVSGGVGFAGLVGVNGSNLEMVDCRVEENNGGGLRLTGGSAWVTIDGCEFVDHSVLGGATLEQVGTLLVRESRFARNAVGSVGGGMQLVDCTGTIEFCEFERDSSRTGQGGALFVLRSQLDIERNTFVACHGGFPSSVHLGTGFEGIFARNVVSGSTGGPALRAIEALGSDSGCNVIWDNEGGDFYGDWNPGLPEIFADPQFCDPENGDFTVHSSSPCVAKNSGGCGDIGAFGVGCGTVGVESRSWGRIKGSYR